MTKHMIALILFMTLLCGTVAQGETAARVSYLGPAGTYTEEAAQFFFQGGEALNPKETVNDAIAGFAAQPVIADIICGLMMSAARPFDIGDRIELEDGTAGIVKDITLRHVVLQGIDTA